MSVIFQTLEDRNNVDYVEANGPFPGNVRDRWLGKGYYFWDTLEESAHFWGRVAYENNGKEYIIARSEVMLPPDRVLNLLEPEDLVKFAAWRDVYAATFPGTKVTVERVLEHARNIMGRKFPYVAIKAEFKDSINSRKYQDRISPNGKAYLDLKPAVQICICDKAIIGKDNFKVIYPSKYTE